MSFFGAKKNTSGGASSGIPDDILSHIRVMGEPIETGARRSVAGKTFTPSPGAVASAEKEKKNSFFQNSKKAPPLEMPKKSEPVVTPAEKSAPVSTSPFLNTLPEEEMEDAKEALQMNRFSTKLPDPTNLNEKITQLRSMGSPIPGDNGSKPENSITFQPEINAKRKKKKVLVYVAGILFICLVLGAGGYYGYLFYQKKTSPAAMPLVEEIEQETPEEMPKNEPEREFFTEKANVLSVNVETITKEGLRELVWSAAERVRLSGIDEPVEFVVSDSSGLPIAFSRFALLSGLTLRDELLSLVDEKFSLYVYRDAEKARIGMALQLKNDIAAEGVIKKFEGTTPAALSLLYPESMRLPRTIAFRQSPSNAAIRFAILPGDEGLSFDYTTQNGMWYIGTSKNTLRSILEKKK